MGSIKSNAKKFACRTVFLQSALDVGQEFILILVLWLFLGDQKTASQEAEHGNEAKRADSMKHDNFSLGLVLCLLFVVSCYHSLIRVYVATL